MPTLDWLNRAQAFTTAARVPYRLLEEVSVHAPAVAATDPAPSPLWEEGGGEGLPPISNPNSIPNQPRNHDNLLIQGDNLEALKALLPFYRGQVKCIFIDPPYNTKSAFAHYDDNLEHAQWLSMMLPRLQLLRELLREDGSIWVTIDDNEGHYLKVLMDEVFGRGNFVANVVWQKKASPQANTVWLSDMHDHIICFAKNKSVWSANRLPRTAEADARYENLDGDPRGVWMSSDFTISLTGGQRGAQFAKTGVSENIYELTTPSGRKLLPTNGRCWGSSPTRFKELVSDNRIWFGTDGSNVPRLKRFLTEVQEGIVATTIWLRAEVGDNQDSKREVVLFNQDAVFATPKPERLLQRILHIATNPNDLILDSFLGSGTTAAVAHKMGRRWIGIEMGEHAATHCLPRLQKVIDGEQGGISKAVNWQGGGSFCFMTLGAPVFDEHGRIHPDVRFATLAAFVWQQETGTAFKPATAKAGTPYLGTHYEFNSYTRIPDMRESPISIIKKPLFACYLLFNGILGDKRPAGGNVLTREVLAALLALHREVAPDGTPLVIYGESVRIGPARLAAANVTFKQIPYDISAR